MNFPESNIALEKIIEYFDFLITEYDYKIISKKCSQYFVEIIYENKNASRIIEIGNETNYTDYGFTVAVYKLENYTHKNKCLISSLRKPFEEQDKECIFIKNASQYLYKNYSELIEKSNSKIIKIK